MSDAERLKKEINYLSVLIKQHKEGKQTSPDKRSKFILQNHFQSGASNRNLQYVPRQKSQHQTTLSYIPSKVPCTSAAPTSAMMASTTGVSFQSKFKWTKNNSHKISGTETTATSGNAKSLPVKDVKLPAGQISDNTVSKSATLSKQTATMTVVSSKSAQQKQQNLIKNTRYKYHKTAETGTGSPENEVSKLTQKMKQPRHHSIHKVLSANHPHNWPLKRLPRTYPAKQVSTAKWTSRHGSVYKLNHKDKSYSISHRKLSLANKSPTAHHNHKKHPRSSHVIERHGRSKFNSSHITLSKAALEGLLKRHAVTMKQVLASRAVAKSHKTAKYVKQDQKQQHCLYYGRFGKCMRGDSCKFIHDPSRIAVCTRFLRGTCRLEKCSFSHKVEKEKISVCLFFLRGKCTVVGCPYMHVYSGRDATVCRRFATAGFCPDADKCKMLHIKCCPEFYETGNCPSGKSCDLPHLKIHKPRTSVKLNSTTDKSDETGTSNTGSDIKNTDDLPSPSPDFLSLSVDSPQPINKSFKPTTSIFIKPRFGKFKTSNSSQ